MIFLIGIGGTNICFPVLKSARKTANSIFIGYSSATRKSG